MFTSGVFYVGEYGNIVLGKPRYQGFRIKFFRDILWNALVIARGLLVHRQHGAINDQQFINSLVWLFCNTRGLSNRLCSGILRWVYPPTALISVETSPFCGVASPALKDLAKVIEADGYARFEQGLPEAWRREIVAGLEQREGILEGPEEAVKTVKSARYEPERPLASVYRYRDEDVYAIPAVQRLVADPWVRGLAQKYLGSEPMLINLAVRWSTALAGGEALDSAGQRYHFDFPAVKWISFFFYLTDVGSNNGPFCFIRRTHRGERRPPALMQRGYKRIPEEDILSAFSEEDIIEFTGPAGTAFACDTMGFHKGKPVTEGHRLVGILVWGNCIMDPMNQKPVRIFGPVVPELAEALRTAPQSYRKIALAAP